MFQCPGFKIFIDPLRSHRLSGMASYGEEGGECGVDEELSRDVQSLQAVLAGEGGDSEHTGRQG